MIYMDNAATTIMKEEVLQAMTQYMTSQYANPGGIYRFASDSLNAVDAARATIATTLNAKPEEIYITSGGSESDNWALRGIMEAHREQGNHIITTAIEHHAILRTCAYLEKNGCEVTYIKPDPNGIMSAESVRKAIRPSTILISVMAANNEIGTIQPIREIAKIAHENNVLFHTDAVAAYGHVPLNVREMGIDLLSASAHKFHGPKGIGFLYVKSSTHILPLIYGGQQEQGYRAGTQNVPGIVGMARAAEMICKDLQSNADRNIYLRNRIIERITEEIPEARLTGDAILRLPTNVHFCIEGILGEALIRLLDKSNVAAATGAACTSGREEISHVLMALGYARELAQGSLRLTFSDLTTPKEIEQTCDIVIEEIKRLKRMTA